MRYGLLNLFSILSILLLVAAAQFNAQTPQSDHRPRTASVSGQVTIGGQPASNVAVKIVEIDTGTGVERFGTSRATAMREPNSFNAITDAGGRYRIAGLAAGTYQVGAASKAYVLAKQVIDIEPARY